MNQSLNQYYIFYTVASCGNFSSAAKKLFISQPAVSKSVARLEEELCTKLFYRTTKGVVLTDSGTILYKQLDIAFRAIEHGEQQIERNEALGAGQLSIGVSTTLCKYVLLPYLQRFVKEHPHIKLSIRCQPSHETIQELKNGTLDIGLIGETEHMEDLYFHAYRQIQDAFVGTKEYLKSLPIKESEYYLKPLLSQGTLLLLDGNNYTRQYIDRYMLQQKLSADRILEVSTMDLLIDFAKSGFGIACVIQDFVKKELEEGSLVLVATDEPVPSRQIGFAYSAAHPVSRSMEAFLEELLSAPEGGYLK